MKGNYFFHCLGCCTVFLFNWECELRHVWKPFIQWLAHGDTFVNFPLRLSESYKVNTIPWTSILPTVYIFFTLSDISDHKWLSYKDHSCDTVPELWIVQDWSSRKKKHKSKCIVGTNLVSKRWQYLTAKMSRAMQVLHALT